MATHRYLLADPVTDLLLGPVPLSGVSYGRRISTQGDFSGTLPVSTPRLGELARALMDRPLALYAERTVTDSAGRFRRSDLWWGGLVWAPKPARGSRGGTTVDLTGATFESYPAQRRIWSDLDYTGQDRVDVLRDLWARMQAEDTTGNTGTIRVETPAGPVVGGDGWYESWAGTDSVTYGDAMTQLTGVDPGFEWTVDVWREPDGSRHRRLRAAPLLGRPATEVRHLLCSPATLVSYEMPVDHTLNATHALGRGTPPDGAADTLPIVSPLLVDADAVAAGVLRVDAVVDVASDVDDVVISHAQALLRAGRSPASVTVRLPEAASFSPANLGDYGRVIIEDPLFPGGRWDDTTRVIGVKVTPEGRGQGEEVTFEFQTNDDTGDT